MAKNIYDLFNERKYGVDYLVEGVNGEIEEVEAYESLDEASLALLKITRNVLTIIIIVLEAFSIN